MKILFASDSFKGSLTSSQINQLLTAAAQEVFPGCDCRGVMMADGGEGTLEAVLEETGGSLHTVKVKNPLFEEMNAQYGITGEGSALVEMARASGLPLIGSGRRNPAETTSYGTGQLIADAISNGCREITVSLGGSATNDGGMGAMRALGARFLDESGAELAGRGGDLEKVRRIEADRLKERIRDVTFTAMCDVISPLLGERGATYTFGPQKGADAQMLKRLECGMENYASVLRRDLGVEVDAIPGGGAAGGLGAALLTFCGAKLKSGVETVLDLLRFDSLLPGVSLVVTGEGRIDCQSAEGKVVSGVGKRCKAAGVPAVAIVGGIAGGYETIYDCGICSVMPTISGAMTLETALKAAEKLYFDAALRMFRLVRAGIKIGGR